MKIIKDQINREISLTTVDERVGVLKFLLSVIDKEGKKNRKEKIRKRIKRENTQTRRQVRRMKESSKNPFSFLLFFYQKKKVNLSR